MRFGKLLFASFVATATAAVIQAPLHTNDNPSSDPTISNKLFSELEELARIVDIAYCVGNAGTGIWKPFRCISRCSDFESFELVTTFNTGPLLSDSCGYVAISHPPAAPRIIVAFRGTYSIANTIADLSTVPQEYVPYPGNEDDSSYSGHIPFWKHIHWTLRGGEVRASDDIPPADPPKCDHCMIHSGFYTSWLNTRKAILPELIEALKRYPTYQLTLVGHSLGGAVAAIASLDLKARGYSPRVVTFGEPRIGNEAMNTYLDSQFSLPSNGSFVRGSMYQRVTHAGDPIPLLPLDEWGYKMHAGEVFITKEDLPPARADLRHCSGDEDTECIAGSDDPESNGAALNPSSEILREIMELLKNHSVPNVDAAKILSAIQVGDDGPFEELQMNSPSLSLWPIPARYKLWQLFFAHRDYFWRLGLCVPGGDPKDWYRKYPHDGEEQRVEL